jgi:hypothetical protein
MCHVVREMEDTHDEIARCGEVPWNVAREECVRIKASFVKRVDDVVREGTKAKVDV